MTIRVAQFLDVASGLQPKQFSVGGHVEIASLDELDPMYKQLLDRPIACVLAVIAGDGRPNLTPCGSTTRATRCSSTWRPPSQVRLIRNRTTLVLVNPDNAYHWVSIRCSANEELSEDDPAVGERVTAQLDRIWTKYTQQPPPYGLRDPSIDERRAVRVRRRAGGHLRQAVTRWPRAAHRRCRGSLGGSAALVLRDLGADVTVYERSPAELERASGDRLPARQLPVPRRAGRAGPGPHQRERAHPLPGSRRRRRARRGAHLPLQLVEHRVPPPAAVLRAEAVRAGWRGHRLRVVEDEVRVELAGGRRRPSTCSSAPRASAPRPAAGCCRTSRRSTPATWPGGAWSRAILPAATAAAPATPSPTTSTPTATSSCPIPGVGSVVAGSAW